MNFAPKFAKKMKICYSLIISLFRNYAFALSMELFAVAYRMAVREGRNRSANRP
jgi:hypothetical protein